MSYTVANTALTNTWDYWRNRTNELATAMSTVAVTTNSNTATGNAAITGTFTANVYTAGNSTVNSTISGAGLTSNAVSANYSTIATLFTVGNSTINATANSTALRIPTVYAGNSTVNTVITATGVAVTNSTANISLGIPSASAVAAGNYYLNANGQWVQITTATTPITSGGVATVGTSQQVVDSYLMSSFAGAEYALFVKNTTANGYMSAKILTTHDTGQALSTEWATMTSNGALGVFNAFTNSTHVVLSFTPSVGTTNIKFARVIL